MSVYLDYAASTPINTHVHDWILDHLELFGNPSSPHQQGKECRDIIDTARENLAEYMQCDTENIIFTSGASQANTLALTYHADNVIWSAIEHSSVIEGIKYLYPSAKNKISVDINGFVNQRQIERALSANKDMKNLVVVQWANNEIGTIQDIATIADLVHSYGGILFVDATQIFPWLKAMDLSEVIKNVDILSASAHKCGGMKGTGLFYSSVPFDDFSPVVFGHQEHGLVGGTENTLSIGAFGEAVKYMPTFMEMVCVLDNRNYLYDELKSNISNVFLNGPELKDWLNEKNTRLPNNLNILIDDVQNDTLIQLLDSMGIYCSGGSACNSHVLAPSYVLKEIGLNDKQANSSIRLSIDADFDPGASILLRNRIAPLVDLIRQSKQ